MTKANGPIRTPHDVPNLSIAALIEQWQASRLRSFVAKHIDYAKANPDDLFAELALSTCIAEEVTAGRWFVVAELLRAGAVDSWCQIGAAMGKDEIEARDGFHGWLAGQANLRYRTGTFGFTIEEAEELHRLSEGIPW